MTSNQQEVNNDLTKIRESKGFTLDHVSDRLKLTKDVVEKLENSQFKELGAYTYVRGYLINYCQLLEIDSAPYIEMIPRSELQSELINTYSKSTKIVKFKRQSKGVGNYAVGTFIVLALSFTAWYFLKQYSLSKNRTLDLNANTTLEITPQNNETIDETAGDGTESEEAFHYSSLIPTEDVVAEPVSELTSDSNGEISLEIPQETTQSNDNSGNTPLYQIELLVNETSWIEIEKENGERLYFDLFQPGLKTFESDQPLHFRIGNENQVTLKINGEEIDLSPYSRKDIADFDWPQ